MGLVTKTYWKWDSKYNVEEFSLGKTYSVDEIRMAYELIEKRDFQFEYSLKENKNVKIITKDNTIILKSYSKGGKVEGLTIERDFQHKVETSLEKHLEKCDKLHKGQKLILGYLDGILGIAILKA